MIKCICAGTVAQGGIWVNKSRVSIYDCTIRDKTGIGILADGSVCFATVIKGSNNNICIQCGSSSSGNSSLVIGDRHEITGTTKYVKERGGIIFVDGALA